MHRYERISILFTRFWSDTTLAHTCTCHTIRGYFSSHFYFFRFSSMCDALHCPNRNIFFFVAFCLLLGYAVRCNDTLPILVDLIFLRSSSTAASSSTWAPAADTYAHTRMPIFLLAQHISWHQLFIRQCHWRSSARAHYCQRRKKNLLDRRWA